MKTINVIFLSSLMNVTYITCQGAICLNANCANMSMLEISLLVNFWFFIFFDLLFHLEITIQLNPDGLLVMLNRDEIEFSTYFHVFLQPLRISLCLVQFVTCHDDRR